MPVSTSARGGSSGSPLSFSEVPCNGCTACCHKDGARLLDESKGDDPTKYKVYPFRFVDGKTIWALQTKENGDCIHLTDGGCGVWPDSPYLCRTFDCRALYSQLTERDRREIVKIDDKYGRIFEAAKERLDG